MHRHADTVVVNFDPDNAGANAAEKAIQFLLDEGVQVRVVALEGGLDPDEYVKQYGAEAYRAKARNRQRLLPLAGGPRAAEVRHEDPPMAAWTRSSFCCRRCRRFPTSWSARRSPTTWRATWAWIRAWCWINSRRPDKSASRRPRRCRRSLPDPAGRADPAECCWSRANEVREQLLDRLPPEITERLVTTRSFRGACAGGGSGRAVRVFGPGRPSGAPAPRLYCMTPLLPMTIGMKLCSGSRRRPACGGWRAISQKAPDRRIARAGEAAEREGRVEEAIRWMAELSRLERKTEGLTA